MSVYVGLISVFPERERHKRRTLVPFEGVSGRLSEGYSVPVEVIVKKGLRVSVLTKCPSRVSDPLNLNVVTRLSPKL